MTFNYLEDTFDRKLRNILEIRSKYYDEACVLIFVFLDFLSNFIEKPYPSTDPKYNRANFRFFLANYSGCEETLKYVQIERFINDFKKGVVDQQKYKKYVDKIGCQLERVKSGEELPVSCFLSIDEVDPEHIQYFQKYTLYNQIYDLRNSAVHRYITYIERGSDFNEPFLSYTENINKLEEGWYNTYIPFDFLYRLVDNCYKQVRSEFKEFVEKIFAEDIDFA